MNSHRMRKKLIICDAFCLQEEMRFHGGDIHDLFFFSFVRQMCGTSSQVRNFTVPDRYSLFFYTA